MPLWHSGTHCCKAIQIAADCSTDQVSHIEDVLARMQGVRRLLALLCPIFGASEDNEIRLGIFSLQSGYAALYARAQPKLIMQHCLSLIISCCTCLATVMLQTGCAVNSATHHCGALTCCFPQRIKWRCFQCWSAYCSCEDIWTHMGPQDPATGSQPAGLLAKRGQVYEQAAGAASIAKQ